MQGIEEITVTDRDVLYWAEIDSEIVGFGEYAIITYADAYWGAMSDNNAGYYKRLREMANARTLCRKGHAFSIIRIAAIENIGTAVRSADVRAETLAGEVCCVWIRGG